MGDRAVNISTKMFKTIDYAVSPEDYHTAKIFFRLF